MAQKFANAARAVLAAGIASGDTTVTIVSGGSLFPEIASPDFARAVLQDANGIEIVLITAHTASADSFTITRAQEGTTARSFAAGSIFGIRVTAADMDEALDAVNLATEVTGVLPITNGGTGQTTRQAALDALAGAVTAGQYLRGDGTDVVMSAIQAADVPTLNQNTTGTASNVTGTVAVANGGTGLTAPGTTGNVLTSNGTVWVSSPASSGGLSYIYTTTAVTATNNQGILTDTAGGSFTVTLPATPSVGNQVVVADAGNNWGTNNLTVGRNGSTIGGLAEDLVCDINGASVQFVYDGTTWEVYAQIGGQGGSVVTLDGVQTLTNKTISGADNTLTVDGTNAVGFRIIPQNSQSAAYTAVLADSGKQIFHPSADTTARTFTIPANSSVAYPIGTALSFINQNGAGVVTIAITTDTMRLAGAGTTGSRTLAANGVATAIKLTATEWIISGTGLT